MKEFKINKYLILKLEKNRTNIYVNGEKFDQCKFLFLNIPINDITSLEDINSIDEFANILDSSLEKEKGNIIQIPPETEFWGHCSNIQVWFEYNYNTRLLHSNLAFPLLKKLTEVGDPLAKRVFKEEIIKRFHYGYIPSICYLFQENYHTFLDDDEIHLILLNNNPKLKQQLEILDENMRDIYLYILIKYIELGDQDAKMIIKRLDFDEIDLSETNIRVFPEALEELTSLKKLKLIGNNLTKIPETIENLTSLQIFEVSLNKLKKLPKTIGNLISLQKLNLSNNLLIDVPESLATLMSLKELNLGYNQLKKIPKTIEKSLSLQKLSLRGNKLNVIPEGFGNLTSLQVLDLGYNQLIDLPETLKNLSSIRELDLRAVSYTHLTLPTILLV